MTPGVVEGMPEDSLCLTMEQFGPLVALTVWNDEETAIRQANKFPVGLAGYVFAQVFVKCTRQTRAELSICCLDLKIF